MALPPRSGRRSVQDRVDGPFIHHVYIGFAVTDMPKMVALQKELENRSISCYPRFIATDKSKSTKTTIDDGFMVSQKCLIYVSVDYLNDEWFTMESQKVAEKVNRFSQDCVFLLLDEHVDILNLPSVFTGLIHERFTDSHLNDQLYLESLAKKLRQEPNPKLNLMPKENIGYGSALGYFYGFLRLVLPDFRRRLEEQTLHCGPSSNTVKKMLIIMPESCFCPPQFTEDGKIEHTDKYVVSVAHRAGNKNRDYKSSLYKIIDSENQAEYYFVGELATPLLTMYESYYFGLANMSRDQLYAERNAFYVSLKAILSHPQSASCHNQFKLLFWGSDPEMNKPGDVLTLYDFLLPIIRKEIVENRQQATPTKGSVLEADSADISPTASPAILEERTKVTFTRVLASGSNPAAIYDDTTFGCYKMSSEPRGICLIINIASFTKGHEHLKPRRGAEVDARQLKELFGEKLHFDVQEHTDIGMETLEKLLLTTSNRDHSSYDAFVCCFLTHGKLGVLYTADAKPIRILDIADYFNDRNCSTLRGKPKMFFIQACMKGSEDNGSSPSHGTAATVESQMAQMTVGNQPQAFATDGELEGDGATLDWDANIAPTLVAADAQERTWLESKATLVPGSPDFVMSYATLPGSAAYRDTETGSLYVSALVSCLSQHMEIDRALRMVTKGVSESLRQFNELENSKSRFQLPFHLCPGMVKLLRLN